MILTRTGTGVKCGTVTIVTLSHVVFCGNLYLVQGPDLKRLERIVVDQHWLYVRVNSYSERPMDSHIALVDHVLNVQQQGSSVI